MPFTLPRDKIKDMVEIVYNRNCVYQTAYHVMLTVRHSETQSPTLMRPTTPGGEIRCPQKNETGYFECPRLHNSAETIPEP